MIVELLRLEKIVTGLAGELPQALERLFARSSFPDRVGEFLDPSRIFPVLEKLG